MCRGQFRSSWTAILTPIGRCGCALTPGSRLNRGHLDPGSQARKLTCHVLIATFEVLHRQELGRAPGAEGSDHDRGPGPDVGDGDDVPTKGGRSTDLDSPSMGVGVDPGPEGPQLADVLETAVETALLDHDRPLGLR